MSAVAEAQGYVISLIDRERLPLKAALPAIARRLGITPRRLKALRYGEAPRIGADELAALKRATAQQEVSDAIRTASRLEQMANRLAADDAGMHADAIAQARAQAERLLCLAGRGA